MLCSVNVNIRTKILLITSVTLVVVKFTEKCLGELVLHCFVKFIPNTNHHQSAACKQVDNNMMLQHQTMF